MNVNRFFNITESGRINFRKWGVNYDKNQAMGYKHRDGSALPASIRHSTLGRIFHVYGKNGRLRGKIFRN